MKKLSRYRFGFREKLALWIFAVTVIAIAVNYVTLVPRLDSALKSDRVNSVEAAARKWTNVQQSAAGIQPGRFPDQTPGVFEQFTAQASALTGYRVRVLEIDPSRTDAPVVIRTYDEGSLRQRRARIKDQVALDAMRTGRVTSGITRSGDTVSAETAFPLIFNNTTTSGVVVFSDSLSNATAIINKVSGRIVVAGLIALAVALIVGMLAARTLSLRVRRLERAALQIAQGNFTQPLPIDSSDELGELARAFNTMQERLGRADRSRKAFIATASHELRTPLFSLGGYMELLQNEDLDPETQQEFLETMDAQIKRLQKLATDLLDLSRIDSGTLDVKPETVELSEVVDAVAREFEPQAAQHDSEIALHNAGDPVAAECDPERVAQVVRILVDNALSHTPPGTNIDISLQQQNGAVKLAVSDDGPGIPAEQLPRLFERFHTGDKSGGTGLGLSIAREIANAMSSQLDVTSVPKRTVFTLTLPPAKSRR